jgi:hypothetical protein
MDVIKWIKKIHTCHGISSDKKVILPFVATLKNPSQATTSKISQMQKDRR